MSKNLINYRLPEAKDRYFYQFYDGKAFYSSDYENRRELMEEELGNAIRYIQRVGNGTKGGLLGELNYGFVRKLLSKARKSFERESVLYRAVGIPFNENLQFKEDKASIESDLIKIKNIGKEITNHFNPPDTNKTAFLNKMNDKKFLDSLTMEKQTALSFVKYGESYAKGGKRVEKELRGKMELTKAINRAMNKTGDRIQNYNDILNILNEDFKQLGYDVFSSPQVTQSISDIIETTLKESFPAELFSLNSSARLSKMLSYGERKERATIKRFYKALYKEVEIQSKKQSKNRKYLGGALILTENIIETPYGVEIIQAIYPDYSQNIKSSINSQLDFQTLADKFINLLEKHLGKSNDEIGIKAKEYLVNNRQEIKNIILQAYSKNESNESKLREFAQFSKNGVSGLLGEIASAISLSTDRTDAIITGSKTNSLGQKIAIDTNLIVYSKNGRSIVLGIQVKNYTSTNNVRLYSDQSIGLTEDDNLSRYIPTNDIKVLRFLISNMKIIDKMPNLSLTQDDLELFLYAFIPSLLRTEDLTDDLSSFKNNFYYINNRIYPTSELILEIILKAASILEEAKRRGTERKLMSFLNFNEPNIIDVERGEEVAEYYALPHQPPSEVRGIMQDPRGIKLKADDSLILPLKTENLCSDLSKIRIHFNGIRVNTNR